MLENTFIDRVNIDNKLFKFLFDIIPSPIFFKDINMVYRYCNDAFAREILGLEKNEIVGKSLYDFPEKITKEFADIYNDQDRAILRSNKPQVYEEVVRCYDGSMKNFRFNKSIFSHEGEILGIIGIMSDISDYTKALKKLNKQNKMLNNISITDFLTNLYNRRYFEEILNQKIQHLSRQNDSLVVAMLDIDFFKQYNDFYGHSKGDELLKTLSQVMADSLRRQSDFVFRVGGEEFCFIFNASNLQKASNKMKELTCKIDELKLRHQNSKISDFVTVCIGVLMIQKASKNATFNKIYFEVDKLLYEAKQSGRNKIISKSIYM